MAIPGGIEHIVHEYGAAGLFVLLALGITGVPVPDETLLTLSGYLVSNGQESYVAVALAAFGGSALGISLSFVIGHYPIHALISKYGHWIYLTEERYQKADAWFQKRGKLLLTFGYFIPGFRHLTAIAAGASGMSFSTFALFAWAGALLWSNAFISLGYYTGKEHTIAIRILHQYFVWVLVVLFIFVVIFLILYRRKKHE